MYKFFNWIFIIFAMYMSGVIFCGRLFMDWYPPYAGHSKSETVEWFREDDYYRDRCGYQQHSPRPYDNNVLQKYEHNHTARDIGYEESLEEWNNGGCE